METVSASQPQQAARGTSRWNGGWFVAIAAVVIAADQLSKWGIAAWLELGERWPADSPVRLVHVTNSGAAFGILQGAGPLLVLTSIAGAAAIVVYLFNPDFAQPLVRVGLSLMFGGAVGNLIDRVSAGEVVDFVKFPHWPAFNVADSAITVGVLCLLWTFAFEPQEPRSAVAS